jgi:hypothetical protein
MACYAQGNQYTDKSEAAGPITARAFDDRVDAFWQARKAGDLVTLFELEAVNVTGQLTLRQYMNKGGGLIYKDVKILGTKVENPDEAYAEVKVEVVVPGLKGTISSQFKDQWVNLDGQWYHRGRAQLPTDKDKRE